jgi:hypothetical protein
MAGALAASDPSWSRPALPRIVKDAALARVLGETLFRDTVAVISAASPASLDVPSAAGPPDQTRDGGFTGQVARSLLAHQPLDKYLWLIQQSFDASLWRGADRSRLERNFPLIWRTSIILYESSLDASPTRVRVCTPNDSGDGFDCNDQLERARMVPIPSQLPGLKLRDQPNMG